MEENNVYMVNETYNTMPQTLSIHDIIGTQNEFYMNLILLSSSILLLYVIWMNFFINSKYQKWLEAHDIDIHELSILPTIVLVITTLAYKGMI
jgi:hypothetical protein